MDSFTTTIRDHKYEIITSLDQCLRSMPEYIQIPGAETDSIAEREVNYLFQAMESGDQQPLVDFLQSLTTSRIDQGVDIRPLLRMVDDLENIVLMWIDQIESTKNLWLLFSRLRSTIAITANQVLIQRQEALKVSEEQYQAAYDASPIMFWLKDTQNNTLRINRAAAAFEGVAPEAVEGKSCYDIYPYEQAEAFYQDDLEVIRSGLPKLGITEAHTAVGTGKLMWVETGKTPVRNSKGEIIGVLAFAVDITERKEKEQQVVDAYQRRGFQVQLSTQIAQEIAMAPALNILFERVVSLIKQRFGYYHVQLLRYDPFLNSLILVAGYGEVGQKMLETGHRLPVGVGLTGSAAATGKIVLRPDVSYDPDWQPNPLLPNTKGEIAVPIKFRDKVLGVLDVQSDSIGALTEDDSLLLEGLCGQIAIAIENTRLRQEMEERLEEINALYQATAHEGWQLFREKRELAPGYAYDNLGFQLINDWTSLDNSNQFTVPISIRGEVIGSLGVIDDPMNPLEPGEQELIEEVSQQVALALESARLYAQTQDTLSQTQLLYEGGSRIIASTNIHEALQALVVNTPLQKMDDVYLFFFNRPWESTPPENMVHVANWHWGEGQSPVKIGTTYQLAEYALVSNHLNRFAPLLIDEVLLDERVDEKSRAIIQGRGAQSLLYIPLVAGSLWYGLVEADYGQPIHLVETEIRLIERLSEEAAAVIYSLRLQEEMRERLREMTALQAMMSREAWAAYQAQAGERHTGYAYDRTKVKPLPGVGSGNGVSLMSVLGNSAIISPLLLRGEQIGILGVEPETDAKHLTSEDEAFLGAIAEQVAQALERARLIEQTQKTAAQLQAVTEVGTATSTILQPDELLQQVVDLTNQQFGLYHTHIYLLDEDERNLILRAGAGSIGRSMTKEGWSIPLDQHDSIVAKAGRERRGVIVDDTRKEAYYLPNSLLPKTLSELAVPMIVGERLFGVFDVQSDTMKRFTEDDVRIFGTLAAQVAIALQNAKLYAEQLATVERLRELDNMKSAFLANMSHELRTPLNSILGFTQVLQEELDGPLTDLMVSDLELIEKNGKHLLNLINDVLDMAKIEAGRFTLAPEPINLYELMEDVIFTNATLARSKALTIDLVADPMDDWIVIADQVRLRQIIINLVGNSIKFTEHGGVTIEMDRLPATSELAVEHVQVRVKDTGIGIPSEKLDEIFEAFSQVDSSTTRKVGGTGLGLPISRRLVELHGGQLWAESSGIAGQGSVFYLNLPVGGPPIG